MSGWVVVFWIAAMISAPITVLGVLFIASLRTGIELERYMEWWADPQGNLITVPITVVVAIGWFMVFLMAFGAI